MAVAARPRRRKASATTAASTRYTVDASVFVNAFNRYEAGHEESLALLRMIAQRGDPVLVPTLMLVEVASAVARATDDTVGALEYALATANLPHITVVPLTPTMARQAAEFAARHRLRGADAVYVTVARRYAATLVSRDREQLARGGYVVPSQTPEQAIAALAA
jgi:predicted nucleic acid-binding protein